ncbi:MAG: hypothetical protein HFG41_13565 [Coprococcus sp.]|nr:hypothetical protein [Coprococcus sp.]
MSELKQLFAAYKNSKIAIYGLGKETERVLSELLPEFQIIGLLDGYKQDGILYGMSIISLVQAVQEKVDLILVAARPGPCRTIAKRIGKVCIENQIDVIDVLGNNLQHTKNAYYNFRHMKGIRKQELLEQINLYDVISFDLFDTLLMRQVLFPEDVFELVDYRLKKQGVVVEQFPEKRMSSEKKLAEKSPSLVEIYTYMRDVYHISGLIPEVTAELERQVDYELIIPRKEVCDIFKEAVQRRKCVYIVSDSYYTKEQLAEFLNKCGITEYKDILSSCDYHTAKTQSLFQILKDLAGTSCCMHIGDDKKADIEHGEKNGIETCHLCSGIELLESAGYMGMWHEIESFSDKLKAGMFTARIFNSPFQFENENGKICITNIFDIAYLFFAPVICDFIVWFYENVHKKKLLNIFFCARDGYLIKKLYDELEGNAASVYFLTSRIAAVRAGMENDEDIRYIEGKSFDGSIGEELRKRFGISVDIEDPRLKNGSLMDFSKEIIDRSSACRKRNRKYLDKLNIKDGDIAFFDFVAKGTSQMYVQRMIKNHLKGFYFLQLEKENMRDYHLDIESFFELTDENSKAVFENYDILEIILTSPFPSVVEFDNFGEPVYAEDLRTTKELNCIQDAQNSIYEYFKNYLRFCPMPERQVNKNLDEILLSMALNVSITDASFLELKAEDSFFNRTTDITELL